MLYNSREVHDSAALYRLAYFAAIRPVVRDAVYFPSAYEFKHASIRFTSLPELILIFNWAYAGSMLLRIK